MKRKEKYLDIGFAKLDIERQKRKKAVETIYCESKTDEQLIEIFKKFDELKINAIGTRASKKQYDAVKKVIPEVEYHKEGKIITLIKKEIKKIGQVAICTGGTGDIPMAEEAAITAEFFGSNVKKYYDIGIAGINRLLDNIDKIREANVIIVLAGMEGALAGIITGLVDVPVIAVPTSIGYGSSFKGLSALLTMLNSCAEGMMVVNIDNGFGAGYSASQINRKIAKE